MGTYDHTVELLQIGGPLLSSPGAYPSMVKKLCSISTSQLCQGMPAQGVPQQGVPQALGGAVLGAGVLSTGFRLSERDIPESVQLVYGGVGAHGLLQVLVGWRGGVFSQLLVEVTCAEAGNGGVQQHVAMVPVRLVSQSAALLGIQRRYPKMRV